MKLKTIVNAFSQREGENALILKVLDTLKDFNRRLELKPAYRELKDAYDEYVKEQTKIVTDSIKEYCDEENKTREEKLIPEKITRVPMSKMEDYRKKVEALLETDIKIKKPLKFTQKEIEESKIVFSEMELLDEFINYNKES